MNGSFLDVPRRDSKPRSRGLTSLLDAGVPHSQFRDVIESSAPLIAGFEIDRLVFEAPNQYLQTFFVQRFGCDVNLGNVAFTDVIALETLRLGLRADTFSLFDGGA